MVNIQTTIPKGLLAKIRKEIDAGHVRTWAYDKDGDFTHTPPQWAKKAWLRPAVASGELSLEIVGNTKIPLTNEIYGVYHGRFIEMLLAHFPSEFIAASAN